MHVVSPDYGISPPAHCRHNNRDTIANIHKANPPSLRKRVEQLNVKVYINTEGSLVERVASAALATALIWKIDNRS